MLATEKYSLNRKDKLNTLMYHPWKYTYWCINIVSDRRLVASLLSLDQPKFSPP